MRSASNTAFTVRGIHEGVLYAAFGSNVLKTLQTSLNDIRRIIRTDTEDVYGANAELNIVIPGICIDFFSSFSEENERVSELAEAL